ncbi:MAG: hypothetical protein IPK37_12070 [Austwickia sp.]|nr:MAG: hypothetical protein IPK37_12070 [Austwickia sp.]
MRDDGVEGLGAPGAAGCAADGATAVPVRFAADAVAPLVVPDCWLAVVRVGLVTVVPVRVGAVGRPVAAPLDVPVAATGVPGLGATSVADAVPAPHTTSAVATGRAAAAVRALLFRFLRMLLTCSCGGAESVRPGGSGRSNRRVAPVAAAPGRPGATSRGGRHGVAFGGRR